MQEKFTLTSPDIAPGARVGDKFIFKGFGLDGGNVSPALEWKNAPAGTKSFVVTCYDPDAPTGSGWWHWMAFNLPAGTTSLPQGAGDASQPKLPAGTVQARNDYAVNGYGGPCPPPGHGDHRYVFTVHALKVEKFELEAGAPPAMVGFCMFGNKLGEASFTALYSR